MKIRIRKKSKQLNESITTDRYSQIVPKKFDGDISHASEEVQDSRIEIAMNIDRFLQRPFVTVGEEILNDDGEEVTITDPKETNLLLYVYRGIGPGGEILKGENIQAVNRELDQRVGHFLMGLSPFDQKVLASDIDALIKFIADERTEQRTKSHASTRMLKKAPGHFDEYLFATRSRSVYKDTRAGKDFMLKKTPELKNIPEQHHFIFSMENLMKRVKNALKETPDESVPPLDAPAYDANYRLGTKTEVAQQDTKASQAAKSMSSVARNLFLSMYGNPNTEVHKMPIEQQFNLMAPYFEILLRTILKRLNNNEYPKEFFELEKIADSVPSIFFDEYEKELDSYIMGMELLGFDKEQ
jgi:hypothetical protein